MVRGGHCSIVVGPGLIDWDGCGHGLGPGVVELCVGGTGFEHRGMHIGHPRCDFDVVPVGLGVTGGLGRGLAGRSISLKSGERYQVHKSKTYLATLIRASRVIVRVHFVWPFGGMPRLGGVWWIDDFCFVSR